MKRRSFISLAAAPFALAYQPREGKKQPEKRCKAEFVDGTHQQEPDCTPRTKELTERCTLTLYKVIFPGSQYDTAAGRAAADAELKRTVDFYAKYCIDITVVDIPITDKKAVKKYTTAYQTWIDGVVQRIGGKDKLGKASLTKAELGAFHDIIESLQADAEATAPKGRKLVVVFMDEYIGGSDGRDTLVSSSQESMTQIGIDWVDKDSSHILAHELIHTLGKTATHTGDVTWEHSSNCKNALSKVDRTNARIPTDLSGRFLDVAEYLEIGKNRCGGLLKCHKIP